MRDTTCSLFPFVYLSSAADGPVAFRFFVAEDGFFATKDEDASGSSLAFSTWIFRIGLMYGTFVLDIFQKLVSMF